MRRLTGTLYLIPSTLGETGSLSDIPSRTSEITSRLRNFIVENDRTARAFLKRLDESIPLRECTFNILDKRTTKEELTRYLDHAASGGETGLLSEAGCPCTADPGADAVKIAHERSTRVVPLTGPSSILLSLMASGFNGQNFAFNGYLPVDKAERRKSILFLEKLTEKGQTQIFIETPYRNDQIIEDILSCCRPATKLCAAIDLTLDTEEIISMSVSAWKKNRPEIGKRFAIFLLGYA
jgi:16S rRNA (cytidine1402-2'-O)-methyltransferase